MASLLVFKKETVLLSYRNATGNCVGRHKTPSLCWNVGRPFGKLRTIRRVPPFRSAGASPSSDGRSICGGTLFRPVHFQSLAEGDR